MADAFLAELEQLYTAQDPLALAALLDPTGYSTEFLELKHALNSTPQLRPSSYQHLTSTIFPAARPFADFVAHFLLYVRDANLDPDDSEATGHAYGLLASCYRHADKIFAQSDTPWFVPTLRRFTTELVALALRAGTTAGDLKLVKAGEAARMLARPMGIAAADRSQESPCKRDALFFLANATFKVYFALSNLRLCDTVINSTQSAAHHLDSYPKADRVAFAYYRGRIYLYQRRLAEARRELQKAFNLCSTSSPHNARLIFTYLVVASLPLGIFPTFDALEEFDLFDQFAHLVTALQVGHFNLVLEALDNWRDWHLAKGNYLLLREKLEVICWRNLARRTLFVTTDGDPLPATGPPTLNLQLLLTTARFAFSDPTLDLDDIECMCASLMDQGYIKAYQLHSKKLLVLQKGPLVGFPPISSVR